MLKLSVNVDHVATLRQARGAGYPDPVEAAGLAERAGASGITVHLRGDHRHIQDRDLEALKSSVQGKLNLEMAATDEMCEIALRHRPDQVSLVPERPQELTTEGGLDLRSHYESVLRAAERLHAGGILVSAFLDPDPRQIEALAPFPAGLLAGFEINTDAYTRAGAGSADGAHEIARVASAAHLGRAGGYAVFAGHGLSAGNVAPVAAIPEIEELNIGHALISRALMIGMTAAVKELLAAMAAARA